MNVRDPNVGRVELVANALGELRDKLVLVGGSAAGLLITDPAAPPVRATLDIDFVVQAATLTTYHEIEAEFTGLGFKRDMAQEAPICRWVYNKVKVDLMPTDADVLGFTNKWYATAIETDQEVKLPSGTTIRLISAPAFLATKFEAFASRGKADLLTSHDLEDILNVIDGRPELLEEVHVAPAGLRSYLVEQCSTLLSIRDFRDYLPGMLNDNDSPPARAENVFERLNVLAHLPG